MNKLKVLLFASLRDAAGTRLIDLEVPFGATVADLKISLYAGYPALARWQDTVKVAVNQEYAADDRVVPDGAEIALIPPVSGG
jgi:molybdopterin converting factor subunit 1